MFTNQMLNKKLILEQKLDRVWTCFIFEGCDHVDVLHVTHKFFREEYDPYEVKKVCEDYFRKNRFSRFTVPFDRVEMFGEDNDVRVLRPQEKDEKRFLPDLKERLDEIEVDTYDVYKPHASVSSNVDCLNIPIEKYQVRRGNDVYFCTTEFNRELEIQESIAVSRKREILESINVKQSSRIQSFVFDKSRFTEEDAKTWLSDRSFSSENSKPGKGSVKFLMENRDFSRTSSVVDVSSGVRAVVFFED